MLSSFRKTLLHHHNICFKVAGCQAIISRHAPVDETFVFNLRPRGMMIDSFELATVASKNFVHKVNAVPTSSVCREQRWSMEQQKDYVKTSIRNHSSSMLTSTSTIMIDGKWRFVTSINFSDTLTSKGNWLFFEFHHIDGYLVEVISGDGFVLSNIDLFADKCRKVHMDGTDDDGGGIAV
jgi:hypothetical protein